METNNTAVVTATNRNIIIEILASGTSKRAIAIKAGISTSAFHRKVTGAADFTLRELGRVAEALNLTLADIISSETHVNQTGHAAHGKAPSYGNS